MQKDKCKKTLGSFYPRAMLLQRPKQSAITNIRSLFSSLLTLGPTYNKIPFTQTLPLSLTATSSHILYLHFIPSGIYSPYGWFGPWAKVHKGSPNRIL